MGYSLSADSEYPNRSWFDYEGDTVVLRKIGGNFAFSRPLNGGDPYKDSKWNVLAGMSFAEVRPINFAGDTRPYGVSNNKLRKGQGQQRRHHLRVVQLRRHQHPDGGAVRHHLQQLQQPS